jgi:hypothetical protein
MPEALEDIRNASLALSFFEYLTGYATFNQIKV